MWLVVSVGGQAASGDPKPRWFAEYGEAWYEMRRRLGVEGLHRKKHNKHQRFTFGPHEAKRQYRGLEWRPELAEDYQAETMRRAPLGGSGGVTIYQMLPLTPTLSRRRDRYVDLPANLQIEPTRHAPLSGARLIRRRYALYPDPLTAQRAVDGLRAAGVPDPSIVVMSSEPLDEYEFGRRHKTG